MRSSMYGTYLGRLAGKLGRYEGHTPRGYNSCFFCTPGPMFQRAPVPFQRELPHNLALGTYSVSYLFVVLILLAWLPTGVAGGLLRYWVVDDGGLERGRLVLCSGRLD
ncbi:hypothetical protein LZ31DRAFT_280685 [Colletotrichum somersetense]|nr:hypothetical protein LZ31DRAFT_280685 [Colletotrichum somersetense]